MNFKSIRILENRVFTIYFIKKVLYGKYLPLLCLIFQYISHFQSSTSINWVIKNHLYISKGKSSSINLRAD